MNWRVTLGLLVVAAALGGYVFLGEANKTPPVPTVSPALRPPTSVSVSAYNPEDISAIAVRAPEGRVQVAKPPAGNWTVTDPRPAEADQTRMASLAIQLASLTATGEVKLEGKKAADFGLDPATMTVTITKRDGTEEITVGDQSPVGDGYYIRKNKGDSVYVLPSSTVDALRKLVTDPPFPKPTPAPATPTVAPRP